VRDDAHATRQLHYQLEKIQQAALLHHRYAPISDELAAV